MRQEFNRTDGLFSLCGLNCGLCPMQIRGGCSGCFNGSTCYLTCPIAPCSVKHGNVQYCYQGDAQFMQLDTEPKKSA